MIDHAIAATSPTATAGPQPQAPRQATPPRLGGALQEPRTDPHSIHLNNPWHDTIWPTREELGMYDRVESLLHESRSRQRQHQRGDLDAPPLPTLSANRKLTIQLHRRPRSASRQ